jgi:CRP-like cAMP-binding protein
MPPTAAQLSANRLLAVLPQDELQQFQIEVQVIELADAEILSEPGNHIQHAYFPIAGCIALSNPDEPHPGLEIGLIGDEGMFGASLVLGTEVSSLRAVVHGAGRALRIDAASFSRRLQQCPQFRRVLKHYIHVLMEQLAQSMVCIRFHLLQARLARLLLMIGDRAHSRSFHVTQEKLARRLGVRRAGVTAAAIQMQHRGLISYHRGDIQILDRVHLLSAACSCFSTDNATYRAAFAGPEYENPGAFDAGNDNDASPANL